MKSEQGEPVETVRIELTGYTADEVQALVAQFESASDVVHVSAMLQGVSASSTHDALQAVLADTTLVAQITEQAAKVVGSVGVVMGILKTWGRTHPPREGQNLEVSGPNVIAESGD